jgi:hypothetical protein
MVLNSHPPREVEKLVAWCRAIGSDLVIGCDANAHHTNWRSSNINNSSESLFNFIMANDLDIMNKGNRPTFQYSLLGRTAASIRLNTTFRGLAPSPSSGKTDQFLTNLGESQYRKSPCTECLYTITSFVEIDAVKTMLYLRP